MIVCSIKDRASNAFGRPFYVPAVGVAIRSFQDEVNRQAEDSQIYHHPDDFDLFHLGEYDDGSGSFDLFPEPVLLMLGKQAKATV